MKTLLLILLIAAPFISISQNVAIGTAAPDNSAMLDVTSSNKGLLIPRMNSLNRTNILAAAPGLMVYDTDLKSFMFYNGASWDNIGGSKARRIYIPANALSFTGTGVTVSQWGLNLINTASAAPGFVIPKPVDWDSTKVFTITIHYSFPTITAGTIISWRLLAGSTDLNATAGNAGSGWDSYDFSQTSDATPASIPAAPGRTNLAKTQTWTASFSANFNTWYVGTGVTTNNDFSHDPMWQFRFLRGNYVSNGEGYTGTLTINGVSINYTAK